MGLIATEGGGGGSNYEPIEAGVHHAICYGIIDLGTTYDETWKKNSHKIMIQWEIPELRIDIKRDDAIVNVPRIINKKYTLSLNEKAGLRKDLESWRGRAFTPDELKGFDVHVLLGVNCNLNIVHQVKGDKTYANIQSIMPLMKTQNKIPSETPMVFFSLDDGDDLPPGLGKYTVEQIMASDEWKNREAQQKFQASPAFPSDAAAMDDMPQGDSDVPF